MSEKRITLIKNGEFQIEQTANSAVVQAINPLCVRLGLFNVRLEKDRKNSNPEREVWLIYHKTNKGFRRTSENLIGHIIVVL